MVGAVTIAKHEGARRAELVGALYSMVDLDLSVSAAARTIASVIQVHRSTVHRWEETVRNRPREQWARLLRPGYLLKANPVQQKVWDSLRRVRKPITAGELASLAETSRPVVIHYLRDLDRGGYLVRRRAADHNSGRPASGWHLIRETGPRAPRALSGGAVYDPNRDVLFVPAKERA